MTTRVGFARRYPRSLTLGMVAYGAIAVTISISHGDLGWEFAIIFPHCASSMLPDSGNVITFDIITGECVSASHREVLGVDHWSIGIRSHQDDWQYDASEVDPKGIHGLDLDSPAELNIDNPTPFLHVCVPPPRCPLIGIANRYYTFSAFRGLPRAPRHLRMPSANMFDACNSSRTTVSAVPGPAYFRPRPWGGACISHHPSPSPSY